AAAGYIVPHSLRRFKRKTGGRPRIILDPIVTRPRLTALQVLYSMHKNKISGIHKGCGGIWTWFAKMRLVLAHSASHFAPSQTGAENRVTGAIFSALQVLSDYKNKISGIHKGYLRFWYESS
ncbi:MAG: hypothetical protein IJM18_07245, partial [Clostridia bacterium]|nr:hypothetical protein [Clostridia bacterium]